MSFSHHHVSEITQITGAIKKFTTIFQSESVPTIDHVLPKLESLVLEDLNPCVPITDPRFFHPDGKVQSYCI